MWRAHISNDDAFKEFVLPNNCVRDLRKTIYEIVPPKISDLNSRLHLLKHQRWNYIFIKPENKKGIYHIINYNDNISLKGLAFVHAFEYAIIFILNRKAVPLKFYECINSRFNTLRFLRMRTDMWNSSIANITEQMMENYKNATQ